MLQTTTFSFSFKPFPASLLIYSSLSLQNHIVERMWVEVNKRINYPLKEVLVDMEHKGQIDMNNSLHRFCCSWLTLHVANVGAKYFVASWNAHPIPGTCHMPQGNIT